MYIWLENFNYHFEKDRKFIVMSIVTWNCPDEELRPVLIICLQ